MSTARNTICRKRIIRLVWPIDNATNRHVWASHVHGMRRSRKNNTGRNAPKLRLPVSSSISFGVKTDGCPLATSIR